MRVFNWGGVNFRAAVPLRVMLVTGLVGVAAVMTACFADKGPKPPSVSGRFIDAPVTGLGVETGQFVARETNRQWQAVASSADGEKLVAVVNGGQIFTSDNRGGSWTPRESNRQWSAIASSSDGKKLVALNYGGQIYTSTDSGVSWTARESNRQWRSVASSADGTKLVAVVQGGQIYTSTDSGVNWTPRESNRLWRAVASSADGTKLVAVEFGLYIYTSTDSGENWSSISGKRYWTTVASSADGNRIAVAANRHYLNALDSNEDNWIENESPRLWTSIAASADGDTLVAVADGGQLYRSTDSGKNWIALSTNRHWISVAISADGQKIIAAELGGNLYTYEKISEGLKTIANGAYECRSDSDVIFSLGNQVLGAVKCDTVTHAYQMASATQSIDRVRRITRLLQSLDTNPATTDVIELPDLKNLRVAIRFDESDVEFEADANDLITQLKTQTLLPLASTLISDVDAQAHVQTALQGLSAEERLNLCTLNPCKTELVTGLVASNGVSGTVYGLPSDKTIQLRLTIGSQAAQTITVGAGGFGFAKLPLEGEPYSVTRVDADDSVSCSFNNPLGVMPVSGVNNIEVNCSALRARSGTISFTVSGLGANQTVNLYLLTQQILNKSIIENGAYTFDGLLGGQPYEFAIESTDPSDLNCVISNNSGVTPTSYAETGFVINNVSIACSSPAP